MKTEGIVATTFIGESRDRKKKGVLEITTLYVKVVGIDGCVDEGSTLDIIFENGEKTNVHRTTLSLRRSGGTGSGCATCTPEIMDFALHP